MGFDLIHEVYSWVQVVLDDTTVYMYPNQFREMILLCFILFNITLQCNFEITLRIKNLHYTA